MSKNLRAYKIAEKVMKLTDNKGIYTEVLEKCRLRCNSGTKFNPLTDLLFAKYLANDILGRRVY